MPKCYIFNMKNQKRRNLINLIREFFLHPAGLIAAAVLFLCWKLRGVMLTPVCRGKGQSLELILRVSGASPELEATVDGLLWLINDGVLFGRIVLLDDGMDEETREIARRLSLGQGNVTLWTKQTNSAAPCSSSEP